jgi:hypothetical protein
MPPAEAAPTSPAARPARAPAAASPASPRAAASDVAALPPALADAAAAFAEGRDDDARRALAGWEAGGASGAPAAACSSYLALGAALDAAGRERQAGDAGGLRSALRAGDLDRLREALRAMSGGERSLGREAPGLGREIAQARRAVDLAGRLDRAEKDGDEAQAVALASDLTAALPAYAGAAAARERAAAAIESAAEALAQTGAVEPALARLAPLRRVWPDRPGLAERMERYAAEEKSDQALQGLLGEAAAAEARRRPDEGLALLRDAHPTPRFEARFRDARGRLERQLASLDKAPPSIELAAPPAEYEKGAPARLAFRVTDDYAVKTVVVRARAEGTAAYADLQPTRTGDGYAVDVPPSLHQNRTIEYYVVATDLSGHRGELGTAQSPRKLRRKRWYEKILGGKRAGER